MHALEKYIFLVTIICHLQCHIKYVPTLVDIASSSENCVLAVHAEKGTIDTNVMVCDTFGNILDGTYVNFASACY